MKYISIFLIVLLLQGNAWAQDDSQDAKTDKPKTDKTKKDKPKKDKTKTEDGTTIRIGNVKIEISEKEDEIDIDFDKEEDGIQIKEDTLGNKKLMIKQEIRKKRNLSNIDTRWILLDLGINNYLYDGQFNLPNTLNDLELRTGRSINVNLHLFQQRLNLINHHVNLLYGLSFDFNNYFFENDITLGADADSLTITYENDANDALKKNKLATTFLQMPIMLNFVTNPHKPGKAIRFSAGVFGGIKLSSRTKQKSEELGKIKRKDDFNLNDFRAGLVASVGIGGINLYAKYSLTPLFQDQERPKLHPFSVGISIIPY